MSASGTSDLARIVTAVTALVPPFVRPSDFLDATAVTLGVAVGVLVETVETLEDAARYLRRAGA
jgi:hypothetical protein